MDKIKTGNLEVISSGSFVAFSKNKSQISFKRGKEKITLELVFIEKKEKEVKMEGRGPSNNVIMNVEMPSITNSSGEGFNKPFQFGNFDNGDMLSLFIWVRKINDGFNEITYSVYVEEKQK